MLNIYGKNNCNRQTFETAFNEGFKRVELQLINDFLELPVTHYLEVIKSVPSIQVTSVHPPIINHNACDFADMLDSHKKRVIYKAAYLADALGHSLGRCVPVVVHAVFGYDFFRRYTGLFRNLIDEFDTLLYTFPNIEISLENTIPLHYDGDTKGITSRGTDLSDNLKIVRDVRDVLKTNRINAVVDTCHLLSTIRIKENNAQFFDNEVKVETLESYFKEAEGLVHIIHLCNCIGYGMGSKNHGTPFVKTNPDDCNLLKQLANLINTYCPEAMCVLELSEPTYAPGHRNPNKLATLDTMRSLGIEYTLG